MKPNLVLISILILQNVAYHWDKNNDLSFKFHRYIKHRKDTTLYEIKITDIEGVDWQNRSFKIKKGGQTGDFPCGLYYEYLTVSMGDKIIDTINMFNPGTSNKTYFPGKSSMLTFHPRFALSSEGWLVIFAYPIDKDTAFRRNDEIFNLLVRKKLLNYSSWTKKSTSSNSNNTNEINKNEIADILKKFKNEFGQDMIRALENTKSRL